MPVEPKLVRVPTFFTPAQLVRLEDVARDFKVSRSEVVRDSVRRGISMATRDYRARQADRDKARTAASPVARARSSVAASPATGVDAAVSQLCDYVEAIRAGGRTVPPDSLRDVLETHASTLKLDPDDVDEAVAEAFGRLSSDDAGESLPVGPLDPHQPPE